MYINATEKQRQMNKSRHLCFFVYDTNTEQFSEF